MEQLENIRRSILEQGLSHDNLNSDPVEQFGVWLEQARVAGLRYPNAMILATVSAEGQPVQRFVMLRQFDKKGFVFYTSLSSRKAEHLAQNPNVSILFPWHMLERQVQITGRVEPLGKLELMRNFASSPRNTQLSSWLSMQQSPVNTRSVLESKLKEIKSRFAEGEVSMPSFWGGYRIVPESFEFWQSGQESVNDRFIYRCQGGEWSVDRIAP